MREVHRTSWLAAHGLVALVDEEDPNSQPDFPDYSAEVVFGPRGVAVRTTPDADIDVLVAEDDGTTTGLPPGSICGAGEIRVGNGGLLLTDGPVFDQVTWPPGVSAVTVFTRSAFKRRGWVPGYGVTGVTFVLRHIGG